MKEKTSLKMDDADSCPFVRVITVQAGHMTLTYKLFPVFPCIYIYSIFILANISQRHLVGESTAEPE